jgi:hypothetical protein
MIKIGFNKDSFPVMTTATSALGLKVHIDFSTGALSPEVYWYLKSLNLKFQKNWTKIEAVRSLLSLA